MAQPSPLNVQSAATIAERSQVITLFIRDFCVTDKVPNGIIVTHPVKPRYFRKRGSYTRLFYRAWVLEQP